jgi:hypothetical protein
MKKQKIQSLSMAIGSMLVIAIVCSQFFHASTYTISKKEVKTEQQKTDRTADDTFVSLPSFSLPAPVHVQLNLQAHCLFEIFNEDQQPDNFFPESASCPQKLFSTLFRVIISPNAP